MTTVVGVVKIAMLIILSHCPLLSAHGGDRPHVPSVVLDSGGSLRKLGVPNIMVDHGILLYTVVDESVRGIPRTEGGFVICTPKA